MTRDENSFGKYIAILHRNRKSYVNKRLEPYGISGGQFVILLSLSRHDGVSQEKISDQLKIDKTLAAKSIKKLELNGYLRRETDPSDRRAYNVFLTPKAHELIPLIRETKNNWEKAVMSGLSKEECRTVEKILGKMADNSCIIYDND